MILENDIKLWIKACMRCSLTTNSRQLCWLKDGLKHTFTVVRYLASKINESLAHSGYDVVHELLCRFDIGTVGKCRPEGARERPREIIGLRYYPDIRMTARLKLTTSSTNYFDVLISDS